jgi:transposase-like protein
VRVMNKQARPKRRKTTGAIRVEIKKGSVCPLCSSSKVVSHSWRGLNMYLRCEDCNSIFRDLTPLETDLEQAEKNVHVLAEKKVLHPCRR